MELLNLKSMAGLDTITENPMQLMNNEMIDFARHAQ